MPMTEYSGNTEIITNIGTTPQERGLTTDEFKAKFDEGLKAFVTWFNDTHKTEFDAHLAEKATQEDLGHIKKGSRLNIDVNGVASVDITDIPLTTTANTTYYVATTGSDENDGLSSGTPYKTINKALNQIPQIVNHIITIHIANGTYAEAIVLQGKLGFGRIFLAPSTDVILSGYAGSILSSIGKTAIGIKNCSCEIVIANNPIKIKPAGNLGSDAFTGLEVMDSISSSGSKRISINRSDITTTGAKKGVVCFGSTLHLFECVISANNGIEAAHGAHVHIYNNTGSNGGAALIAIRGAVISKEGTVPSGTTAESTESGGVIR